MLTRAKKSSSRRPENQSVHGAMRKSLENVMKAMLVMWWRNSMPGVDENERRINEDRM